MTTATQLPETIRATVHDDAISRVTRFFNATTFDTLIELLQNARRAKAHRVDVTIGEGVVTVADDGNGIADPSAILSFGHSDWDRDTAGSEDPAGMGMYSLSRYPEVTIQSRQRGGGPAWRVRLTEDHFLGKLAALVETVDASEKAPCGTIVTFRHDNAALDDVEKAARFYPLPVYCNGVEMGKRHFLDNALYVEEWRGIRIGAYPNRYALWYRDYDADINFHGLQVRNAKLPVVETIGSPWSALADVQDCPELELMLPARREVVENDFLKELREAAKGVIYRAILHHGNPQELPFDVYQDALGHGVVLPTPEPRLELWNPNEGIISKDPVDPGAGLVMDCAGRLENGDQHTLYRAAKSNGTVERLFKAEPGYRGYEWYDRLAKVDDMDIACTLDNETSDVNELRRNNPRKMKKFRPDSITFTLCASRKGGDSFKIDVPADVAFVHEELDWYNDDVRPLVTKDSDIDAEDLIDLMMQSFFDPNEDYGADSVETQEENWRDIFQSIAIEHLRSAEDAVVASVKSALERHVKYLLPMGWQANITIAADRKMDVIIQS